MVASISARGNVQSALAYYSHLSSDLQVSAQDNTQTKYYVPSQGAEHEAQGRWVGKGAERLTLPGQVQERHFKAALNGMDPITNEQLVNVGGRSKSHSAGWDITFSAPKSVSVVWALSDPQQRERIEQAQQHASKVACTWLEENAAFARRGKAGKIKEATAGLLIAQFDHETSRDLDPQLHTHSFIFNMAPRQDGSWGAIVSRDLYIRHKAAGQIYQQHLEQEMQKLGYQTEKAEHGFRLPIVPLHIEKAFSKRRQAIEQEIEDKGYKSAAQLQQATLRTRKAKVQAGRSNLFEQWEQEAKDLGFKVERVKAEKTEQSPASTITPPHEKTPSTWSPMQVTKATETQSTTKTKTPSPVSKAEQTEARKLGRQLGLALIAFQQSENTQGLRLALTSKGGSLSLKYEEEGSAQTEPRKERGDGLENEG